MGHTVTYWVIAVVVGVVGLRVHGFKRACDIEGVVDDKCDFVFLEEVFGYSYHQFFVSVARFKRFGDEVGVGLNLGGQAG